MSIVRTRKRVSPFVQIDRNVFENSSISWKAKGILGYLLSKPDDWETYIADLEKRAKDGRDAVRTGLKELEAAGYVVRVQARSQNGKFAGWEYEVHENPVNTVVEKPENGKSDYGNSEDGKPQPSNNESSNNELTNISTTTNAFEFYEQNFSQINGHLSQDIGAWLDDFNGQDEILIEAMKIAIDRNKRSWGYTKGILKDWHDKGAKNLKDALALQNESKPKVNIGTHTKQNGGYPNERTQQNSGNTDTSEYDNLSL